MTSDALHHPLATNAASELNWLPATHDAAGDDGDDDDDDDEWGRTGKHRKSPLSVVAVASAAAAFSDASFGVASFYRGAQAVGMD